MIRVENALARYYGDLQRSADLCRVERLPTAQRELFAPDFELPELTDSVRNFLSASSIQIVDLGYYSGVRVRLLDLTCNPRTRTTKTFAAQIMVARAVRHIQKTGESIMLVTPTSANKGSALRDAVLRALEAGLVDQSQLNIAIVVPRRGISKLWTLPFPEFSDSGTINPICVVSTEEGRVVKDLTMSFVREYAHELFARQGTRLWHTYDLDNYRCADAVRAFVEAEYLGPATVLPRIHAQAVSSAFGVLGHHHGWRVLKEMLSREPGQHAEWLLVQHLGTPDLVLDRKFGSFSRNNLPPYIVDGSTGLLVQSVAPEFPNKTYAVNEIIDSTFYSHHPNTAPAIAELHNQYGGAGIVVSLCECLERYAYLRQLLRAGGPVLPEDPRDLREWALVMALTGTLAAIDRGTVNSGREVLVHVSGSYAVRDYTPVQAEHTFAVADAHDLAFRANASRLSARRSAGQRRNA